MHAMRLVRARCGGAAFPWPRRWQCTLAPDRDAAGPPSRRFRQHVNPLSQKYLEPIALPNWPDVFADPSRPIHLDIG